MQSRSFARMEHPSPLSILDRVLRGDYLRNDQLSRGTIEAPARTLVGLGLALGGIYGVGVGSYAQFRGGDQAMWQALASSLKVPLLFLLTLLVTFPSLYVFAALQRLPLDLRNTLRLLMVAILVHLTILASLAPVFAFFAASTQSYAFMMLLNVVFFAIGGVLSLMVLRRATTVMYGHMDEEPLPTAAEDAPTPPRQSAFESRRAGEQARRMLRVWGIVYGVTGAQMGWLLRPFLGSPDLPFTLFRPREGNFFQGLLRAIGALFGP
jgi:hypothetical protein